MDHYNYLALDPSGTGTTGLFFYNSELKKEKFLTFKNKDWKEHFKFIKGFCLEHKVNYVIYETTDYIKTKNFDMTSLFKLFGAIEFLSDTIPIKEPFKVYVSETKSMYKKIMAKTFTFDNLSYKSGRGNGWFWNDYKISLHELDALLVFYSHIKKTENK